MKELKLDRKILIPVILVIVAVTLITGSRLIEQDRQEPLSYEFNGTANIGVICPKTDELDEYKFLAELAQEDINQYMNEQETPIEFNFIVADAEGRGMKAYEIAKEFHDTGTKLIVGLSWSSQLDTFLTFARENRCLIISPGSTQPWPWRLAPTAYRLYPADHLYTVPVLEAVESKNVSKVFILRIRTSGAEIIRDDFVGEYDGETAEILIDYDNTDAEIEEKIEAMQEEVLSAVSIHGVDHVAVFYVGFSDTLDKILGYVEEDALYSVHWFVWNWYNWNEAIGIKSGGFEEDTGQLARIKLIGAHPSKPENPVCTGVNQAYMERFGKPISMIHGNVYDGLWIAALSVAETGSTDGYVVREHVPKVARHFVGVTGNCSLNDWGDRWGVDWTLWGYRLEDNTSVVTQYGVYNCSTGEITWFEN